MARTRVDNFHINLDFLTRHVVRTVRYDLDARFTAHRLRQCEGGVEQIAQVVIAVLKAEHEGHRVGWRAAMIARIFAARILDPCPCPPEWREVLEADMHWRLAKEMTFEAPPVRRARLRA